VVGWRLLQRNVDVVVEGAWVGVLFERTVSLGLTDPWSLGESLLPAGTVFLQDLYLVLFVIPRSGVLVA
jgi:hypothetical protein